MSDYYQLGIASFFAGAVMGVVGAVVYYGLEQLFGATACG